MEREKGTRQMMVLFTRSANEAKRLARAVQTLTGQYTPPVLTADGRYRLQNESYGQEWGDALLSLLKHNVRANYCTPERVQVELERLVKQGKVTRTASNGNGHVAPSPTASAPKEVSESIAPKIPPVAVAACAAARTTGRPIHIPVSTPMGGAAVAEPNATEPATPRVAPDVTPPAQEVPTVAEFAKRYGVALRSPQRDPETGAWKAKLIFVEEAEDETIYPARCTKQMICLVPTAGPAPTVGDALRHLRDQVIDLEANGERFEDWATRHGFSTDSRTAERGWQRARRHLRDLRGFLGMQLLRELTATAG